MSESKIRGGEPSRVSADGAQMTADARRPQFDASTFSRRLRKAREAKGLSLQDLADAANLSKAHIWELEQARAQNPGANALCDLAKALDVSVVWLFVGDTTSEGRLSSISSREAQAQPEVFGLKVRVDPTLPSGAWRLVPREPDEKMVRAVDAAIHQHWPNARKMAVAVCHALHDAAPALTDPEPKEDAR